MIPCSLLPGELLVAGPVAAQADLHVARRVDVAGLDEPVHRAAVRERRRRTSRAPVSVWVSKWTRPTGPWTSAQARMSGSAIEWSPPRMIGIAPAASTCADRVLDRDVRADRVGREDRRVAEVDDPQGAAQRVDAGLAGAARRAARRADRPRAEARARARRTSARPSARRRSRRPRPRARPGPRCRGGRRRSAGRRSRASRRRRPSGVSGSIMASVLLGPDDAGRAGRRRRRRAPSRARLMSTPPATFASGPV